MDFAPSSKVREFQDKLTAFMEEYVYPAEAVAHEQIAASGDPHHHPQIIQDLKQHARAAGLWNLFLPDKTYGAGLTNLEYAPLAEIMGRSPIAPEVFNCSSAPDTGNMEILAEFGTPEQRRQWLEPLLAGESRSCFSMTEPEVASSDATNIQTRAVRDGDTYVITGRKWFTSNAYHPNCRIAIVMAVTDPEAPPHRRATMILVPLDTPGLELVRSLPVFNYIGEGGHAEVRYNDVRVPVTHRLGEEGSGFVIAQARLGPGAYPSLYALHRGRRTGLRTPVQARRQSGGIWQSAHREADNSELDCRVAHADRCGPPPGLARCLEDGRSGEKGSAPGDFHD